MPGSFGQASCASGTPSPSASASAGQPFSSGSVLARPGSFGHASLASGTLSASVSGAEGAAGFALGATASVVLPPGACSSGQPLLPGSGLEGPAFSGQASSLSQTPSLSRSAGGGGPLSLGAGVRGAYARLNTARGATPGAS